MDGMSGIMVAVALVTFAVFLALWKSKHFLKVLFFSALQGIGVLFAVNIIGLLSGVSIGINAYTLSVSAILSIPGVILLLIVKML